MNKTKLLIVDDTRLVNEGISSLLANEVGLQVVGNAMNGMECLHFLKKNPVDVILLDHQMPGQNGLETLEKIRKIKFPVKVILLTFLNEKNLINAYMDLGIEGCMLKQDSPHEFIFGIHQVARGEVYLSSSVAKVLAGRRVSTTVPQAGPAINVESLTRAEWQVLTLIGQGMSVEEISLQRKTSVKTVSRQKQNIMDKLDIHKETKLMRFAIDHGIE